MIIINIMFNTSENGTYYRYYTRYYRVAHHDYLQNCKTNKTKAKQEIHETILIDYNSTIYAQHNWNLHLKVNSITGENNILKLKKM